MNVPDENDGATKIRLSLKHLKEERNFPPSDLIISASKNDSEALEAINKGDKLFKENKFLEALEHYNKSLCLATKDSENLGIGYANRSAVYLKCGFYKFCLENIELALENDALEKLKPKLLILKKECLELMNNFDDSLDKCAIHKMTVKLSYPAKARMPIIIDGLELVHSDKFGRHIRTKHDLHPGDVIVIEEPFSKCIAIESEYTQCTNCLKRNHLNLLPCQHCTRAMFCSENCRQEAWQRFHKYECKIIDGLFAEFSDSVGIRTTLKAFTMFNDPEDLRNLINRTKNKTAFDLDYTCLTEHEHFQVIYSHTNDESCRDTSEHLNLCAMAWYLLSSFTNLGDILKTTEMEDFFLNTLLHLGEICASHSHSLESSLVAPLENYGTGLFAFSALFNHSCAPNVMRVTNYNRNVVVVRRTIRKGEQIFDSYGPHHLFHSFTERQDILKLDYNFDCDCEACTHDFPLIESLSAPVGFKDKIMSDLMRIKSYDIDFIKQKMQAYKKYLKTNSIKYPSFEVCTIQNQLLKCFKMLVFDMSLELQFRPLQE